ncbi:MAG: phosphodiester glycosidase family protein [Patescibacteria group bacterium]
MKNRTTYLVQRTTLMLGLIILLGAGCEAEVSEAPKQFPQPATAVVEPEAVREQQLPDFMERRIMTYDDGRNVKYILAKIENSEWRWGLANEPEAPRTVKDWQNALTADLVINGSYFDENMNPTGFYQIAYATSAVVWPQIQDENLGYAGMVRIYDGKLDLAHLPTDNRGEPAEDETAFLSFPVLIAGHRSQVSEDSKKYARRTALAIAGDETPYIIVTESGSPSLFEMAKWLQEQPEDFRVAVNLDGGTSTGLYYSDENSGEVVDVTSAVVPNVLYLIHQ